MIKNQVDKRNMPFFDAFKTTAAIGLLMQQTAAMHCPEGPLLQQSIYSYQRSLKSDDVLVTDSMEESLIFIKELTSMINKGYSLLLASSDDELAFVIEKLDPEQTDLIELQLRALEGAVKNVYKDCSTEDKLALKPFLLTISQARAAANRLNNLFIQMTKPIETFNSNIDMEGLKALAKHGTEVFKSGRFH
jgi:hypothetical protein